MNFCNKKLLIVVDYQNDFVIGSLGFKKASEIEDNIIKKIKQYQKNNDDILFTLDTHYDEKFEKHRADNSEDKNGWRLYGKSENLVTPETIFISKHTFASIDLSEYLRDKQYDSVELVGIVTNICVLANAIISQISLPDSKIIIDALCVASNDEVLHEKALDIMESLKFEIINRASH